MEIIPIGRAHRFGDNISTDLIIPGRYFHLRGNLPELAKHTMEDADMEFIKKVKPGDFVVAGNNFGCGSSREHAARVIKLCGVRVVLAKSFARIFFRNAINVGLAALECETGNIESGDELEIDFEKGIVKNISKNEEIDFITLPRIMLSILSEGGLVEYIKKHNGLEL